MLKQQYQKDNILIFSNSDLNQQFQIPHYVSNQFKYNQTLQIREQLFKQNNINIHQYDQLKLNIQHSVLNRNNSFITINNFTERQIARETILQCLTTFLCQKFSLIRESYRQNEKLKEENLHLENNNRILDLQDNQESSSSSYYEEFGQQQEQIYDDQYLKTQSNYKFEFNGFSRPQILILTPYKSTCYQIVSTFLSCFPNLESDKVGRKKLFEQIFAPREETYNIDDLQLLPYEIPTQLEQKYKDLFQKPLEFYQHYKGDISSDFNATITISKRGPHCIYLMRPIDKSDVIITSPENALKLLKENQNQSSFSSFHTIYFDNFDWLIEDQYIQCQKLFEQIHQLPQIIQNVNINTISKVFLENKQKQQCQFITISGSQTNEQNNLLNRILQQTLLQTTKIDILHNINLQLFNNIDITFYKVYKKMVSNRICSQDFIQNRYKLDYAINVIYQNIININDNSNTLFVFNSSFDLQFCNLAFQQSRIKCLVLNNQIPSNQINSICKQFKSNKVQVLLVDVNFLSQRYTKFNKTKNIIFVECCKYEKINTYLLSQCDQGSNIKYVVDDNDKLALIECFGLKIANIVLSQSQYQLQKQNK